MKKKWPWITALAVTLIALTVGASFHGLRMHPENAENYTLGCNMGLSMIIVAGVGLAAFIVLFVLYKKALKK